MNILQTLAPKRHGVGGLPVNRILPAAERQMVGPFIFVDHGGPIQVPARLAKGVPEHPHAGLSTFTYLIGGTMNHRDSAGHAATIQSGDIALMTAGRGITHEEIPPPLDAAEQHDVHFLQLWLALPDSLEESEPTFEHHRSAALPTHEMAGARVRVAMGSAWGLTAPTTCHTTTVFAEIQLEPGGSIPIELSYDEVGLIVLEGEAQLGDESLERGSMHILAPTPGSLRTEAGCRAVVLGGAHFPERRWIGGSFVASSREKLDRWMRESRTTKWPRITR